MSTQTDAAQLVTWATKGHRIVRLVRALIAGNAVALVLAVAGATYQVLALIRGGNAVLMSVLLVWSVVVPRSRRYAVGRAP